MAGIKHRNKDIIHEYRVNFNAYFVNFANYVLAHKNRCLYAMYSNNF